MNPQYLPSPAPRPAGLVPEDDGPTHWTDEIERAWNAVAEGRPHRWQLGLLLTRDILSSLFPAPLWRIRQWRDD